MAFSALNPGDSDKIRIGPAQIRSNWDGIEQGLSSLLYFRTLLGNRAALTSTSGVVCAPAVPVAVANACQLYGRDPGTAITELWTENSAGNIIQLSQAGLLGSDTTHARLQDVKFGTDTLANNQKAMCVAWGVCALPFAVSAAYGCNIARINTGQYTVTFTAGQVLNANYAVAASVTADNRRFIKVSIAHPTPQTAVSFGLNIIDEGNNDKDQAFSFAVFGGR